MRHVHQHSSPASGVRLVAILVAMEAVMKTISNPTKYAIRAYLVQRVKEHSPPPAIAEIRRQLGWELAPPALRHG